MQRNINHNCELSDGTSIELGPREFEATEASIEMTKPVSSAMPVVPVAEATDPVACPEPIISPWEWPTSGELESDVMGIEPIDVVDVPSPTANAADSAGGAEQPLKSDTIPAPPPTPEDTASFEVP